MIPKAKCSECGKSLYKGQIFKIKEDNEKKTYCVDCLVNESKLGVARLET